MDAIACFHKTRAVSAADLTFINDHVPSNSKIRAFLLDQMVYDIIEQKVFDRTGPYAENVTELMRGGGDLAIEVFWAVRNADPQKKRWASLWRNRCD